ncbi:uncharacterized protein LOC5521613 isoform X2 [Nematostella vectensis]|nr:uncharacterized protein LOC5521613 isoform X2 [Nematostella vectensis]
MYVSSKDRFDIDPPPKRTNYHVIQAKVKTWVRCSRVPLFWKTELYLDYMLCTLLMKSTAVNPELSLIHLGSVEDMHAFHRYIRGTMGERCLAFWIDAERYRRHTKPDQRRVVFREIQQKYLRGGAPFELTEMMKWKSVCGGLEGLDTKSFTSPKEVAKHICATDHSLFKETIFRPLQALVLDRLKTYWVPKYVLHREKLRLRNNDRWEKSLRVGSLTEGLGPDAAKLKAMRERAAAQEKTKKLETIMDQEAVKEYLELHKVTSDESIPDPDHEELERQRLERWHERYWGAVDSGEEVAEEDEDEQDEEKETESEHPTPKPSSHARLTPLQKLTRADRRADLGRYSSLSGNAPSPFPTRSGTSTSKETGSRSESSLSTPEVIEVVNKLIAEGEGESCNEVKENKVKKKPSVIKQTQEEEKKTKELEELKEKRINLPQITPYACAIGNDRTSRTIYEALHENEKLKHLKKPVWERWRSSNASELPPLNTYSEVQRAPKSRIIQLGTSTDGYDSLFYKPRTAHPPHTIEYSKMFQSVLGVNAALLAAVASDRLAGGPLHEFLEKTGDEEALLRLEFWADCQRYLVPSETLGACNKYRMALTLINTYLVPDSPHAVPMSSLARSRLIKLLPVEEGDALLSHVAQVTIQTLFSPWSSYVKQDEAEFTDSVTVPRKKQPERRKSEKVVPVEEVEEAQTSVNMWRALKLAISLATSGFDEPDDAEEEDEGKKIPSLREANKLREEQNYRRGSHFYGHIKKESSDKSEDDNQQTADKVRPNRPKSFHECIHDPQQVTWFKKFLTEQKADTPLLFWQAVENMKNNCKDGKAKQARANVIVRKYFANIDVPAIENLQCKADIIREIPVLDKVTPAMLLSAQACVARTMEEAWFRKYVATFPDEDEGESTEKYATRNTLAGVCKMAAHGKTRGLWVMFASNIAKFLKGIHDRECEAEFIEFLRKEKQATVEHNTRRHALNPTRRMINNKFINTEKLVNDMYFWREVLKFKEIADNATECAKSGNYSRDDERQVTEKARTMVKVFIDSAFPPRVQINIPNDMAENIVELVQNGIIYRGLFHDAAMSVFTSLIHYWKKFEAEKTNSETIKNADSSHDVNSPGQPTRKTKEILKKRSLSFICGIPYRRMYVMQDDETRWCYSIFHGLRLAIPVKLLSRRGTRFHGDIMSLGMGARLH